VPRNAVAARIAPAYRNPISTRVTTPHADLEKSFCLREIDASPAKVPVSNAQAIATTSPERKQQHR